MRAHHASLVLAVAAAACLPDPDVPPPRNGQLSAPTPGGSDPSFDGDGGILPPTLSAAPEFGATVQLDDPPPPLSGGTLAVSGHLVVAADPDRDLVYVIDRNTKLVTTIALALHDEPGRVAIDDAGRAFVSLRGGGAVATIALASSTLLRRSAICSAPRGVAYDAAKQRLLVACATGDLVTVDPNTGVEISRQFIAPDLRDVVVSSTRTYVSTFRDAQLYSLIAGQTPQAVSFAGDATFGVSRVAWRMVLSAGQPLVAQQRAPVKDDGDDGTAPYNSAGDGCMTNGPTPVIRIGYTGMVVPDAVLPVDVATDGAMIAIVAAANGHTPSLPQIVLTPMVTSPGTDNVLCNPKSLPVSTPNAQITSVAYTDTGELLALSREPAALLTIDTGNLTVTTRVALSAVSREDTGHAIFHANSGAGLACASCHPDGREDGQIWSQPTGHHRTPSLLGTVKGTAPYHWMGEAADIGQVMHLTFETRMRGPAVGADRVAVLDHYLGELRAMPAAATPDAGAVNRGKVLFSSAGCASCHSGAMMTNNVSVNINTGGLFQVPSLVGVGWRAPYLHDGAAASLEAVLQGAHAGASLDSGQVSDLTAFMKTF